MQEELYTSVMTIAVQVVNTTRVEARGTTNDPMYLQKYSRRMKTRAIIDSYRSKKQKGLNQISVCNI